MLRAGRYFLSSSKFEKQADAQKFFEDGLWSLG